MDPAHQSKTTAISQIENTLHDIAAQFKKFGTIVA
jgi:hypothetical protein